MLSHNARAQALRGDILAYMRHLRTEERLSLTVHLMQFNPYQHMDFGDFYTVHPNPLCVYFKTELRLMDGCIERQHKVIERAAHGRYCGMCWAGVTEYVYPINDPEGRIAAFISVSGYGVNREKALPRIARVCAQHNLDAARAVEIFDNQLTSALPDESRLDCLIQPLSHMCSLLFYYASGTRGIESPKGTSSGSVLYTQIIRYIESVYTSDITLADICRRFGCSASYVSRLSKRYGGASFCATVNRLRVDLAKSFLEGSDYSIQEISRIVGYNDPNYFSTVFRQAVGVSPRKFRASGAAALTAIEKLLHTIHN